MSAVRETLVAARELIADEEHWIKGAFSDGAGRFCASGALREASQNAHQREQATRAFRAAAGWPYNIPRWNDTPERTHAEVLRAFDAAIEFAAEAERAS